ncbi:unnamed protein product [Caenorhabditis brenneri]
MDDDDASEPTFPLLRLPMNAIKNVINLMFVFRMFGFSLVSKQTLKLVSESQPKKSSVIVTFNAPGTRYRIEIAVQDRMFFRFDPSQQFDQSPLPRIWLYCPIRTRWVHDNYTKEGYTVKNWVDRILKTFNSSLKIDELNWFDDHMRYDVASVRRVFPRCGHLELAISNSQYALITQVFHDADSIKITGNGDMQTRLKSIEFQNYSRLVTDGIVSFETLQRINAKCFRINSRGLSEKEMNRFLKLWAGGTHPQLKHYVTWVKKTYFGEVTTEIILRGIKHNEATEEVHCGFCSTRTEINGYYIYRYDGRRAIIGLEDDGNWIKFTMFSEY